MGSIFGTGQRDQEDQWMSTADLMAGLMVIFLFIAISYIRPVAKERDAIKEIAITWQETELNIYEALRIAFEEDLKRWNAELIKKDLSIRFNAPEVLFEKASAKLKPKFEIILQDFFPRYLAVLNRFRNDLEEVRIEGHTSSEWLGTRDASVAYFRNMALSQARTRAVLEYSLSLSLAMPYQNWGKTLITANGLSSSKLRFTDGKEDRELSRRVEFRVRTKAKEKIVRILERSGEIRH